MSSAEQYRGGGHGDGRDERNNGKKPPIWNLPGHIAYRFEHAKQRIIKVQKAARRAGEFLAGEPSNSQHTAQPAFPPQQPAPPHASYSHPQQPAPHLQQASGADMSFYNSHIIAAHAAQGIEPIDPHQHAAPAVHPQPATRPPQPQAPQALRPIDPRRQRAAPAAPPVDPVDHRERTTRPPQPPAAPPVDHRERTTRPPQPQAPQGPRPIDPRRQHAAPAAPPVSHREPATQQPREGADTLSKIVNTTVKYVRGTPLHPTWPQGTSTLDLPAPSQPTGPQQTSGANDRRVRFAPQAEAVPAAPPPFTDPQYQQASGSLPQAKRERGRGEPERPQQTSGDKAASYPPALSTHPHTNNAPAAPPPLANPQSVPVPRTSGAFSQARLPAKRERGSEPGQPQQTSGDGRKTEPPRHPRPLPEPPRVNDNLYPPIMAQHGHAARPPETRRANLDDLAKSFAAHKVSRGVVRSREQPAHPSSEQPAHPSSERPGNHSRAELFKAIRAGAALNSGITHEDLALLAAERDLEREPDEQAKHAAQLEEEREARIKATREKLQKERERSYREHEPYHGGPSL
jgi:hypothetical protein